jgi:hypothetical protein
VGAFHCFSIRGKAIWFDRQQLEPLVTWISETPLRGKLSINLRGGFLIIHTRRLPPLSSSLKNPADDTGNYRAQSTVFVNPRTMDRLRKICLTPARLLTSRAPEPQAAYGLEG